MADTVLNTSLHVQKWLKNHFVEYVRESGFKGDMGAGSNSIIQVKRELTQVGKIVNIPLITRLKGAGVTGAATLRGNEEALGNFNQAIAVNVVRHAVTLNWADTDYTELDLIGATKDALKTWSSEKLRDALIAALGSIDGVAYGTATATQKNTWNANQQAAGRVLYGNALTNYNATHATALNNVLGTMRLSASVLSLMKRMAKTADPHIRPTRVNSEAGREYFKVYAGSMAFRDLKNDPVMQQANRDARPRDVDSNPLFQDGDLIYDGMVIREIPEIAGFNNTAGTVVRVSPVYLCGAQALGIAWGREPHAIQDNDDYGEIKGFGVREIRGVEKMRFLTGTGGVSVDHGIVTAFVAAPLDA